LVKVSKSSSLVTITPSLTEFGGSEFAIPLEMDWVPEKCQRKEVMDRETGLTLADPKLLAPVLAI
jgi:hypothetical protein